MAHDLDDDLLHLFHVADDSWLPDVEHVVVIFVTMLRQNKKLRPEWIVLCL
jgi:hypothetical protein